MKFQAEFIEKVREANDIVEVIGQHVELKRAGASFRGRCPFPSHSERTASFFVSDVKQVYHCFGCQKSGNVFSFLMDFSGMTFPESVAALAERANIPLPQSENSTPESESNARETKLLQKLNRYVGAYFHKALNSKLESHKVNLYIKKRGLKPETIEEFRIGYAEDSWTNLADFLSRAQAPLDLAQKLGLIKKKKDGKFFDIFRDRLIFPILSPAGHVLGFGGRSLDNSEPKYLNSPESPLFAKGRTLYGLHATAKHIRSTGEVILVEGYMDLVALYQAGIKNVAATLGTALTLEHARGIQKLCKKVIVLFDSDKAGVQAAMRSFEFFSEVGLLSRWLILKGAKDPDEFIQKFGVAKLTSEVSLAPDHFSAYLDQKLKGYAGRNTEKVEILSVLRPLLMHVKDQQLRTLYAQEVAERLNLDTSQVLRADSRNIIQTTENTGKFSNKSILSAAPKDEKLLVQFMLERKEYVELVQEAGVIDNFFDGNAKRLAQKIVEKYCQSPNDFDKLPASLLNFEEGQNPPGGENLLEELIFELVDLRPKNKADEEKLVMDCIGRVKQRRLKAKSKELLAELKSSKASENSEEKLKDFFEMAKEQKAQQRR